MMASHVSQRMMTVRGAGWLIWAALLTICTWILAARTQAQEVGEAAPPSSVRSAGVDLATRQVVREILDSEERGYRRHGLLRRVRLELSQTTRALQAAKDESPDSDRGDRLEVLHRRSLSLDALADEVSPLDRADASERRESPSEARLASYMRELAATLRGASAQDDPSAIDREASRAASLLRSWTEAATPPPMPTADQPGTHRIETRLRSPSASPQTESAATNSTPQVER